MFKYIMVKLFYKEEWLFELDMEEGKKYRKFPRLGMLNFWLLKRWKINYK